ncbi:tyrosine-type recombinase/integrase [Actinoplanes sp. GCM10030250]|uniref:tyrosine-type recombinase/integrase n=1 Tax=Actinoplanes sp. GCM10030250 TaxID=3273376 RepID=UPI0036117820
MRPDNLTDRFNQLAVAAKVRPLGPHQIRHMLASTSLDTGYGIHEVAERLGHDPATLMRYYAKVSATRRRQASDRIAELVTPPERRAPQTDSSTPSPSTVAPVDGQKRREADPVGPNGDMLFRRAGSIRTASP